MKAVVIGSGISGLMSAALLAKAGWDVTVFEQNDHIGGVTALTTQDGFSWEQGPLLLGDLFPGEPAYEALAELGIHLEMIREDRGIVMPDYEMWHPDSYQGPYWRKEQMKKLFPAEAQGLDRYYRFYDDMLFLSRIAPHPKNWKEKLQVAGRMLRIRPLAKLDAKTLMKHFLKDPKAQGLYLGILADFCVAPSEFAGLGIPFVNIETAFDKRIPLEENGVKIRGGFGYVRGTVYRLVSELERVLKEHGGTIQISTPVDQIQVEKGRAVGLRLSNGKTVAADLVIGSGGAKELFFERLSKDALPREYSTIVANQRPMESVFMVHLGLDIDPMKYQKSALCYYYGTYDIEAAIGRLRSGIYHGGDDGFLIYVPSQANPEMAPEGKHCVTLYTVAPDTLAQGDWESQKEVFADRLVALAEQRIPHLSEHVITRLIKTPLDYRKMAFLNHSAFGGVVPDRNRPGVPHETPIRGLYFVGAQSENRGGISPCLTGAKDTFHLIQRQFSKLKEE